MLPYVIILTAFLGTVIWIMWGARTAAVAESVPAKKPWDVPVSDDDRKKASQSEPSDHPRDSAGDFSDNHFHDHHHDHSKPF